MHFFNILAHYTSLVIEEVKDQDPPPSYYTEKEYLGFGKKEGLHGIGITILVILIIVILVCLVPAIIFGITKYLKKRKEFQIVPTFDPDENVEDSEDEEIVAKFEDCNKSEQEPLI